MTSRISEDSHSCLQDMFPEPRCIYTKPALHKLNPSASIERHSRPYATDSAAIINNAEDAKKHENSDKGGRSFLQALTNTSPSTKDQDVYVHPVMKRSASMLNITSLEMCTESLGSETGSAFDESSKENSLLPHPHEDCHSKGSSRVKKIKHGNSFPPPLTSLSGSGGVRVKRYWDDGRLILKAVTIPPHKSCFHAERCMGRLRFHLLNDCVLHSEAHEQEEEIGFANEDGETEDNGDIADGVNEVEKFSRLSSSSCEEDGQSSKSMLQWESFWVAT